MMKMFIFILFFAMRNVMGINIQWQHFMLFMPGVEFRVFDSCFFTEFSPCSMIKLIVSLFSMSSRSKPFIKSNMMNFKAFSIIDKVCTCCHMTVKVFSWSNILSVGELFLQKGESLIFFRKNCKIAVEYFLYIGVKIEGAHICLLIYTRWR